MSRVLCPSSAGTVRSLDCRLLLPPKHCLLTNATTLCREDSTTADAQAAADEEEALAQKEQDLENALVVSSSDLV